MRGLVSKHKILIKPIIKLAFEERTLTQDHNGLSEILTIGKTMYKDIEV